MNAPRTLQPSFASGEIKPELYPRIDIQRYQTGLAELRNAIVLPTGGVTRRPGMTYLGDPAKRTGSACPVRLIEFTYATGDAMIMEFSDRSVRVWNKSGGQPVSLRYASPYKEADLSRLFYAQSGNVVFIAHPDYPVYKFKRVKDTTGAIGFEIGELKHANGPWLSDLPPEGLSIGISDARLSGGVWSCLLTANKDYFYPEVVGKLIELNFATEQKYVTTYQQTAETIGGETWYVSEPIEVGGQYHIQTHNNWTGKVILERSYDKGVTWVDAVSMYDRTDPAAQGNWDISRVEDEKNVLYRMRSSDRNIRFTLSVSSFTKTYIFEIKSYTDKRHVRGDWRTDRNEVQPVPPKDEDTLDHRLGAWGGNDGYPSVITFYQGRLVLAASKGEPQTIWMSRVDDFADFGTSFEIQDDDAVNITITSPDADGIIGIEALDDLLVRTTSGEWRVKGAGEYGAITPTSIVAHRQATEIGGAATQSVITGGGVVFVQTHRRSIFALGYDLSADGYRGNELSIFSDHLFRGKQIIRMVWQKEPDNLLWVLLSDGTLASCTFDASQQMNAWARHDTDGTIGDIAVIPQNGFDELWLAVRRDGTWRIERMAEREPERKFNDDGRAYETCLRTLRVNYSGEGSTLSKQKLLARCIVYTYNSKKAFISPAGDRDRRRYIEWAYGPIMNETDVQLDNGFRKDAGIEIWTEEEVPLTILAVSPTLTAGS